jgi:hypothetical protein
LSQRNLWGSLSGMGESLPLSRLPGKWHVLRCCIAETDHISSFCVLLPTELRPDSKLLDYLAPSHPFPTFRPRKMLTANFLDTSVTLLLSFPKILPLCKAEKTEWPDRELPDTESAQYVFVKNVSGTSSLCYPLLGGTGSKIQSFRSS